MNSTFHLYRSLLSAFTRLHVISLSAGLATVGCVQTAPTPVALSPFRSQVDHVERRRALVEKHLGPRTSIPMAGTSSVSSNPHVAKDVVPERAGKEAETRQLRAKLEQIIGELDPKSPLLKPSSRSPARTRIWDLEKPALASLINLLQTAAPISVYVYDGCKTGDDFPGCVYVDRKDGKKGADGKQLFGSGVWLGNRRILTAAHVVKDGVATDFQVTKCSEVRSPQKQVLSVVKIDRRPEIDAAILYLDGDIPASVPRLASTVELDAMVVATVVGFGYSDEAASAGGGVKRRATLGMRKCIDATSCECTYANHVVSQGGVYSLTDGCSGSSPDSCRGDSGGPLYLGAYPDAHVLAGITLQACADGVVCGAGGVYLRADIITKTFGL